MHCVSVVIGTTTWAFMFNEESSARAAYDRTKPSRAKTDHFNAVDVEITDDFGQTANLTISAINGVMLEDLNKSKVSHIERTLHVERIRMEAQKRWSADPAVQAASRGPAVLQPGGMMPMNGSYPRN